MFNSNMTNNTFDNDKTLLSNHETYSQTQIFSESNSLLDFEVSPFSDNVDIQTPTEKSSTRQPTNINGIKKSKGNYSSQNSSDFKRKPTISKAERRAEHNAIERARRECLNSKFQQLAEILPNLHHHRRPSKGQIVEKALDWVKQNMYKEDKYHFQLTQLQDENKRLIDQINLLQQKVNTNTVTPPSPDSSNYPVYSHQLLPNIYQTGEPLHSKEECSFYPVGNSVIQTTAPEYNFHQNIQMGLHSSQQPQQTQQSQQAPINDDDNDSSSSDENTCDKNISCNQSSSYNMINSNYGIWDKALQKHYEYPQYQTDLVSDRIYLHNTCTM